MEDLPAAPGESVNAQLARKALLNAVSSRNDAAGSGGSDDDDDDGFRPMQSCRPLLDLLQPSNKTRPLQKDLTPKSQFYLVMNVLGNLSKAHARRIFQGLGTIVEKIVSTEVFVPKQPEDEADKSYDDQDDPDATICLSFLKYASQCVEAYLDGCVVRSKQRQLTKSMKRTLHVTKEAYNVAVHLHQALFHLHNCGHSGNVAKTAILSLCEAWWYADGPNKENLIFQCLPILVLQALENDKFQKSKISRLDKMRQAFRVLDFECSTSESLRSDLLRIVSNPLCLKMTEGKRFIATLFQEVPLITYLHQAIRVQIPKAKKSILLSYGEIYLKAWTEANGDSPETRDAIEYEIQDLTHAIIHVASPVTCKSLHTVLEPFHRSKRSKDLESLLFRLYGPIIWRSFSAPNANVRINAITVFAEVFPLYDSSQTNAKESISKGITAIQTALGDTVPKVRAAASSAAARVCATYWDALPPESIRELLNVIVIEHASDSTSSLVRLGALDAASILLEAPASHGVLRALLPSLGNLIHDKVGRVRVSAARLLQQIKKIRGIKFYHVVPVDHLTARLADEGRLHGSMVNPVASELTKLLLNSYFPQKADVSAADQLKRSLTLLATDPKAALAFYSNLKDHLPAESIVSLISMLYKCVESCVDDELRAESKSSPQKTKKRRRGSSKKAEEDKSSKSLSATNASLMESIVAAIDILWMSVVPRLKSKKDDNIAQCIKECFSGGTLMRILSYFEEMAVESETENDRINFSLVCTTILRCAGRLPPSVIKGIAQHLSRNLRSFSSDDEESEHRRAFEHLALLCVWGRTDDVAKCLATSIESAFSNNLDFTSPLFGNSSAPRRRRRSSVGGNCPSIEELAIPEIDPKTAWKVVDHMLQGSGASSKSMRQAILSSNTACSALETAFLGGIEFAERMLNPELAQGRVFKESEVVVILGSCEAYGRLALHKEARESNQVTLSPQIESLLRWTTEKVVPALNKACSGESDFRDLDLSRISNVSESLILPSSPVLASPPRQRQDVRSTPGRRSTGSAITLNRTPSSTSRMIDEPAVFLLSALASALLQSSCMLFAEWLAVGGAGGDKISEAAEVWSQIFNNGESEKDEDGSYHELLPAFLRLALRLCKFNEDFSLLKHVIMRCSGIDPHEATRVFQKAYKMLISPIAGQESKTMKSAIDCVLEAAYEMIGDEQNEMEVDNDVPETVEDIWTLKGCVLPALAAIVANKDAGRVLADRLISSLGAPDATSTNKAHFEARCLCVLLQMPKHRRVVEAAIAQNLSVNRFTEGSTLHGFMNQHIIQVAA